MQIIDYDDFKYSGTNITGIRLLDPTKPAVASIIGDWKWGELGRKRITIPENLKTEAALVYDAVMLFATALTNLDFSNKIDIRPLSCDGSDSWVHGNSLINYMRLVQTEAELPTLTGSIKFGNEGFRNEFNLDIIRLTPRGFEPIGSWMANTLNVTWPLPPYSEVTEDKIVYNISTKFDAPYFSNRSDASVLTGNDRYEGYVVDLMAEVAKIANFSYNFVLAPDNGYGSEINGVWNGMIGDILIGNAQIAVADLTITSTREAVVDFSTPFLNLGISLLFKEKTKQPPELFSFLSPFSLEVWLYMSAAYTGVSLILFILARFSPYEWDNPYPCIQDPDTLENNFTLMNSLWFTIGTVMQQGSDVAPKAPSTRIVGAMWSFFTLIMISSYTANLAAFLVAEPRTSPIEVIEDLPTQTAVKYGCMDKGSTQKFFAEGTSDVLKHIQQGIVSSSDNIVGNNDQGVTKVLRENYAYFMESTSIDYIVNTNCGLRKVLTKLGGNLDSKGYGMAVKKNDPLRSKLTSAILKLQEEEKLQELWQRWWIEKTGSQCLTDDTGAAGGSKALNLNNVGGVFVVLIGGMGMACVIAIIEFMWNIRNSVKEGRGSLCSELMNDLKFVVKCHGSTKPVRKPSAEPDRDSNFMRLSGNYNGYQN